MGFTEILTIIFVILKLSGIINWSWWVVLLPEIIGLVLYLIMIVLTILGHVQIHREFKKHWDNFQ